MERKKILWFCNARFTKQKVKGTGSWLQPLAELINNTDKYKVVNVTIGNVEQIVIEEINGITQYVLPQEKRWQSHSSWVKETGIRIGQIENDVQPSLNHIWGTEGIWASCYLRGFLKFPSFLEVQGVVSTVAENYYGGLSNSELFRCFLAPASLYNFPKMTLYYAKSDFEKRGVEEAKAIKVFRHISVQSQWTRNQVKAINPEASYYMTRRMVRDSFYSASAWTFKNSSDHPVVFTSSSGSAPYKGLHVLLKSMRILKTKYPKVKLRIAGGFTNRPPLLRYGYTRFLMKLIKEYDLAENVDFVGSLTADQLVEELKNANVCVIPSFVESYCAAMAEAMIVGTPCVASFAGAMPEFAINGEEALYYTPNDYASCAEYISSLLENKNKAESFSCRARERRLRLIEKSKVLEVQLSIYDKIINCFNG